MKITILLTQPNGKTLIMLPPTPILLSRQLLRLHAAKDRQPIEQHYTRRLLFLFTCHACGSSRLSRSFIDRVKHPLPDLKYLHFNLVQRISLIGGKHSPVM
jgi:hypothetical protein